MRARRTRETPAWRLTPGVPRAACPRSPVLPVVSCSTSIAVIEGGRVAESGSYGELMDHSGRFHEFVQRQKLTDTTGTPKDA